MDFNQHSSEYQALANTIEKASVGVVMESQLQWNVMSHVVEMFDFLGIDYETYVIPSFAPCDALLSYLRSGSRRGLEVFVLVLEQHTELLPLVYRKAKLPIVVVSSCAKEDCGMQQTSLFVVDSVVVSRAALMAANFLSKKLPKLKEKIDTYYGDWVDDVDGIWSVNLA